MIRKATISVNVLFDDAEVDPNFFNNASLEQIERAMNDSCIGCVTVEAIEPVRKQNVRKELLAIGNDGTFFAEVI